MAKKINEDKGDRVIVGTSSCRTENLGHKKLFCPLIFYSWCPRCEAISHQLSPQLAYSSGQC